MLWQKAWRETRWRFISALRDPDGAGRQQRLRLPRDAAAAAAAERDDRHRRSRKPPAWPARFAKRSRCRRISAASSGIRRSART